MQTYELIITGHSLGAGVAAILAILMHEEPPYRHLKCFAFSPPGGLLRLVVVVTSVDYCHLFLVCNYLANGSGKYSSRSCVCSLELALYSRQFILSVILGDDCVGRLGLSQLRSFKLDLLRTIKDCDLPKVLFKYVYCRFIRFKCVIRLFVVI